ncbi:MAG: hypothetical protein LBE36_00260 [Flavobacteriaceae bacterium]|jgi:hypothetical protein|nr:hypothetical protein [Flavobacteriaceae bacterium]
MTRKILATAFFAMCSIALYSQEEDYNWTFGYNAGLNWNSPQTYTASAITGIGESIGTVTQTDIQLTGIPTGFRSKMFTQEGCFTVSTYTGELMFYSDGITIWDKNGDPMPNANATLTGHPSSAQSGIVIPYPGQGGKYIAFSVNQHLNGNLTYSVVDMSLNGGLGDVVPDQLNIPLTGTGGAFGESLTAVRHPNHRDYWIVAIARDPVTFEGTINVWKVDLSGVDNTDPVSTINTTGMGFYQGPTSYLSYMRFSSDGTKFWMGGGDQVNNYFLANFDPNTGTFSNGKVKELPPANTPGGFGDGSYGVEFSPNGKYVYATHIVPAVDINYIAASFLVVWDFDELMSAPDITTVDPLVKLFYEDYQDDPTTHGALNLSIASDTSHHHFGAVLKGPNDRIYVANAYTNSMFIIPDPDNPDPNNFGIYKLNNILDVGGDADVESNAWGLPVYAAFWFDVVLNQITRPACWTNELEFLFSITGGEGREDIVEYTIDWGDGSPVETYTGAEIPGVNETKSRFHTYNEVNEYTVTFTCYNAAHQVINADSDEVKVRVSTCRLMVNPNVRSWMKNRACELLDDITATGDVLCSPSQATLIATGAPQGAVIRWWDAQTGGTLLQTGNSYQPNVTQTTTYWVEAYNLDQDCASSERKAVAATVQVVNTPTGGTQPTICANTSTTVQANVPAGTTIDWYNAATGGSIVTGGSGTTTLTTPTLGTTTTYYAQARNTTTGCVSATRWARTVTVNPLPAIQSFTPTNTNLTLANTGNTGTVVLTATPNAGSTIRWYTTATGGTPIATGNTYTAQFGCSARTIYAEASNSCGVSARRLFNLAAYYTPNPQAIHGTVTPDYLRPSGGEYRIKIVLNGFPGGVPSSGLSAGQTWQTEGGNATITLDWLDRFTNYGNGHLASYPIPDPDNAGCYTYINFTAIYQVPNTTWMYVYIRASNSDVISCNANGCSGPGMGGVAAGSSNPQGPGIGFWGQMCVMGNPCTQSF